MNKFMKDYFGPLGSEYCVYFYIMSIIFSITFLATFFSSISYAMFNYKKTDSLFYINSFFLLSNSFLAYLINRLLNTMCLKSII